MKIQQKKFSKPHGWQLMKTEDFDFSRCNLVLVFGSVEILSDTKVFSDIRNQYPVADILLNSTAGEIMDTEVSDNTLSVTAVYFEKTELKTKIIDAGKDSFASGKDLAGGFAPKGLKNLFVISDGQQVNGSELVLGLQSCLPEETIITGGLAGDGASFKRTLVGLNASPTEGKIAAIGFYGDDLSIGYGSIGGWDSFGPERLITKSKNNVLYELDGKPALDIYKMYLGEYVNELPSSGLLFPLSIRNGDNNSLVRTILSVNEEEKSLTFAGNMSEGCYARLMKANLDRLIEGASTAAQNSMMSQAQHPDLVILVSCVGRKLVLNHRVEEEIEGIRAIYGDKPVLAGFYSYGEISPTFNFMRCELHNQTMTITTFTEK